MSSSIAIHALLVGINHWKHPNQIKSLGGCHNDVALIEATLRRLFRGSEIRVTALHDEQATAAGIAESFRNVLIAPAKQWHSDNPDNPAASPAFLFHYSGHGTQVTAPAGSKSSGLDETLCTYDMEVGKMFGLRDWMLGELVDELTEYTDNATIVLDCCHSGSGMRDLDDALTARQAPPDLSPPPPGLVRRSNRSASRGAGSQREFRLSASDRSVLLAACKSTQKAFEYREKNDADASGQPKVYGAFTYSLSEALSSIQGANVPTYDQLYRTTARFVSYKSRSQRPQCEGGRERVLFGSAVKPRDLWLSVRSQQDKRWEVDGGLCHGITVGSELAVFRKDARKADQHDARIARLRVVESEAIRCFCESLDEDAQIPLDAPVAVSRLNPADSVRVLRLENQAEQYRDALLACSTQAMLKLSDEEAADLLLDADDQEIRLRNPEGVLLDQLPADSELNSVTSMVGRWLRYFAALEIENTSVGTELANKVEIELLHAPSKNEAEPFESVDDLVRVEHGAIVRIQVTNHSRIPLYINLFAFTSGGEVKLLYPSDAGRREQLAPSAPYRTGRYRLMIDQDYLSESTDTLKVIATKDEADFSLLAVSRNPQSDAPTGSHRSAGTNKVPSSFAGLLRQGAAASTHRDLMLIDDDEGDDSWVTTELSYQLVRPVAETSIQVLQEYQEIGNSGVMAAASAGFSGELSLLSEGQMAHRSHGATSVPPWIVRAGAMSLEPIALESARSASGSSLWALEVKADQGSRRSITADSPLRLRLPVHVMRDDTLAVIADVGSQPFVVGLGQAGANETLIHWLPSAAESVTLYVMKQLGFDGPGLGLQIARYVSGDAAGANPCLPDEHAVEIPGGEVRYRPIGAANLAEAKRALLLVHGFQSDTVWMVDQVASLLKAGVYDQVMTFDYESCALGIGENAKLLAEALRGAGLKADGGPRLDVLGHGMGALVTRALVELEGGDQIVDRCLFAGPANQGTPLATGMRLNMWASTLLLAGSANAPLAARWMASLLKRTGGDANGQRSLRPNSEFLQMLNAAGDRPLVPYHIIAGAQTITQQTDGNPLDSIVPVFWRGYSDALRCLREDENDFIVGFQSMSTVRNGGDFAGRVKTSVVSCDHFNYLTSESSRGGIQKWLGVSHD